MRIIGYIEHPVLKITVFKMDNRLSVKFESGLYEQTYKLRDNDAFGTLADVERLVDAAFCESVLQLFNQMHALKNEALAKHLPAQADELFEEII